MNNLNPKVAWTILIVAVLIVFGAVGIYYWNFSKEEPKTTTSVSTSKPTSSPTATSTTTTTPSSTATPDETADWKTYTNTKYGFSVKYPTDWEVLDSEPTGGYTIGWAGFRPPTIKEDVQWAINIIDKNKETTEQLISDYGKQFPDRAETRESVKFNSIQATKVTVTTKANLDWYGDLILFEKNNYIYSISNGASKDSKFDSFYNSLKFTN